MGKLVAKLTKSGFIRPGYLSPCALGWALGVLGGLKLGISYLLYQMGTEFLWFNKMSFNLMLAWMPQWLNPAYNTSALLPLFALLYGMVLGGLCGLLVGLIYNWAQNKCGCKWCRV